MHHGTLLYSADLSEMSGALNVNREKLVTKGIESVKSRVANISALSEKLSGVSPEEFLLDILRFAENEYGAPSRKLTDEERSGISSLRDSKYATWEWNYGASPSFGNERTERFPFGTLTVMYTADRGILSDIGFFGDFFGEKDTHELEERLKGCRLERESIKKRLSEIGVGSYISGASADDIVKIIFG